MVCAMDSLVSQADFGRHEHCCPAYWVHEGPVYTPWGDRHTLDLICDRGWRHVLLAQPDIVSVFAVAREWERRAYLPLAPLPVYDHPTRHAGLWIMPRRQPA